MSYSIMNDTTILLHEPGASQKKVLDQYRLTEVFRDSFGNYMLDHYPNGTAVRDAAAAVKKFKGIDVVDVREWKSLIIDLIYSFYVLGFRHWEYFVYGFEDKAIAERLEFMPQRNLRTYYKALNTSKKQSHVLNDKYLAYEWFTPYFKREMITLGSQNQRAAKKEEFFAFCRRHPRFVVKVIKSSLGKGVRIVDSREYGSLDKLFDTLLEEKKRILCEELIVCEDSMKAIHPQSVNSVRIYTYLKSSGNPTIVCAVIKAGMGDSFVDNTNGGGVFAAINVDTGIIYTDAADEANHFYSVHPDTGFVFKGFQIPRWEELKKMALELVPVLPGVPLVGWDIALSKDHGWQLIEGNACGMVNSIQVPTQRGCRRELQAAFEWEKHRKKLKKTT